ncbi:MurR/RpiR family transcriptional regulator [Rhodoferax ferrireducens]|uniref:MurR/RpiR family transcriptional regulator n=1 Tax=Rhodoferax ferrireducens TaxID=192843 RepID=UPI000E0DE79D|nr:MurR/RpiR family transcriptional regulator [Rhodoferax ferrireducens]
MNSPLTQGLLQQMRERLPALPEAQRKVVQGILEDPRTAAGATVEQLAQTAQVSMPTVVRTCRSFGYDSVRDFMLALAQDLVVSGSHLHRSVSPDDSAQQVSSKIIHAAVVSLTELGRRIDADMIDRVAMRLAQARRIDCYSVGSASSFMANELQSRLFRMGRTANAIFDAHQQLVSASTLGPDGVAFVISHVGSMPYTLEAAKFARAQGATVVALTQPDTPLARIADLVLAVSVPPDAVMRVGTEAYLAHLLVIEILMVRLAQQLGPQVAHGLQQFKQLLQKHGFDSAEYAGFTDSSESQADPASDQQKGLI